MSQHNDSPAFIVDKDGERPSDSSIQAAAEDVYNEMFKLGGLDQESVVAGIAAILSKHLGSVAGGETEK